jgi:carbon monoxide dehydrogenase subunit G
MELDHEFTVPVPPARAWSALLDVERVGPCVPGATVDAFDGETITGRLKVRLGAMAITYRGEARIVVQDERTWTVTLEGSGKDARGSGTAAATVQATLHGFDAADPAASANGAGGRTRVTVHTKLNVTGRPAQFGRNLLSEVGDKLLRRFADNLAAEITRGSDPAPVSAGPAATVPGAGEPAAVEAESSVAVAEIEPQIAVVAAESSVAEIEPQVTVAAVESSVAVEPPGGTGAPVAVSVAGTGPAGPVTGANGVGVGSPMARRDEDDDAVDLLGVAGPVIAKRAAPVVAGIAVVLAVRWLVRARRKRRGG